MGVAGCGKSTVGKALATAIGGAYLEGDALHPPANIEKMSAGIPLTDEDRWPWLTRVATELSAGEGTVIGGCSALKRRYRDHIRDKAGEDVLFVHLAGSRDLIASRMAEREGHFMPTSLLDSQFEALEPPTDDETAIAVSIDDTTAGIVTAIIAALGEIRRRSEDGSPRHR